MFRELVRNTSLNIIFNALTVILQIVIIPYLIEKLGSASYGQYSLIRGYLMMSLLLDYGLGNYYQAQKIYHLKEKKELKSSLFITITLINSVFLAALALIFLFTNPSLLPIIISFFLRPLINYFDYILKADKNFLLPNMIISLTNILVLGSYFILAKTAGDALDLFKLEPLILFLSLLILFYFSNISLREIVNIKLKTDHLKHSIFSQSFKISNTVSHQLPKIALSFWGYYDVIATYDIALKVSNIPQLIVQQFNNALTVSLNKAKDLKNTRHIVIFYFLPIVAVLLTFPWLNMFFDLDKPLKLTYLLIISTLFFFQNMYSKNSTILLIRKKHNHILISSIVKLTTLLLIFPLIYLNNVNLNVILAIGLGANIIGYYLTEIEL